jgi:hypothetical protein
MPNDSITPQAWEAKLRTPEYNQAHLFQDGTDKAKLIGHLAGLEKGRGI